MKRLEGIRRIVYLRTDRMGDVLMNVPAIHLLRQTYPKAWISVLVNAPIADLFRDNPDVDEVMTVDAPRLCLDYRAQLELVHRLRRAHFDLAVVANAEKKLHLAVFLSGIRHRIGWDRKWPFLLTRRVKDDKSSNTCHEIDSNLRLAKEVSGLDWDGQFNIGRDENALLRVESKLKGVEAGRRGIVAIHPGTSDARKRWSFEKFAALCDKIYSETSHQAVLIGGPEEKVYSDAILHMTRSKPLDLVGELSLKELIAFLSSGRVKALVSSDSGPAHVAWMSGTPAVVMFALGVSGSNPVRWGPRDGKSIVLHAPMNEISADQMFLAIQKILK